MEAELVCKICSKWFNNPVLLPCGHSLCLECAATHYRYVPETKTNNDSIVCSIATNQSQGYNASCPVCGFDFQLPKGGVYGLMKNTCMQGVMTKIQASRDSSIHRFACEFCEFPVAEATAMCKSCNFWYCDACLETMHPRRGPLNTHVIITPRDKVKECELVPKCELHPEEHAEYFCIQCSVPCCKSGRHQSHIHHHTVELVQHCRTEKESLSKLLESLEGACHESQWKYDDHERLFSCLKTIASETEAHVKRETDKLIYSIKHSRKRLLHDISKAYEKAISRISQGSQRCQDTRAAGESLAEYITLLLEEENPLLFTQVVKPMAARVKEAVTVLGSSPKPDWSMATKFGEMSIEVSKQQKGIEEISWLEAPGQPTFVKEECFGRNCILHLKWMPPDGQVDSYALAAKVLGINDDFSVVYEGRDPFFNLEGVAYGCQVTVRVSTRNVAGRGPKSDDLVITMPSGFDFKFSHDLTSLDISLSTDLRSIKSLENSASPAITDTPLTSGIHYWCARVAKFPCKGDCKLEFGIVPFDEVQKQTKDSKMDSSHAVVLMLGDETKSYEQVHNKLLFRTPLSVVKDMVLEFILDLNAGYYNVFSNGILITADSAESTFENVFGKFYPAVLAMGKGMRVDFISQPQVPRMTPDPPEILYKECLAKNTTVTVVWKAISEVRQRTRKDASAYVVEMKFADVHDKKFQEIYRGCRTRLTFDVCKYSAKAKFRVSSVNCVGAGSPSEEVVFETPKGLCFKFDTELSMIASSINGAIAISPNGIINYSSTREESCFLADVELWKGSHSWGFKISIERQPDYIAVGLAQEAIKLKDCLDRPAFCFAVYSNESRLQQSQRSLKSHNIVFQQMPSSEEMMLVLVFDADAGNLHVYLDGVLISKGRDVERPESTFRNVLSQMRPALWIGGGESEVCTLTELEVPNSPGPPLITQHRSHVTDISLHLEWRVRPFDCVDFFIVEMAVLHNHSVEHVTEKFKEVYRGRERYFETANLPYNSEVSCRIFSLNDKGKSESSSLFNGLTRKGLMFAFDKASAHTDLVFHDASVLLTSPVYATVIGNVSLSSGCHYWEAKIDSFDCQNQSAVVGVGIAKKDLTDPVLGEDVYSYAVQIHQYPKLACQHTANKVQVKGTREDAENMVVGVHVDLDAKWMNIYNNGSLVLRKKKDKKSFRVKPGTYFPAFSLYGTNVKVSLRTGVDFEERFMP